MNNAEFQLRGVGDPRLAVHATSALPAWLWSIDGTRILWANPVGARLFGAANGAVLAGKRFGPADQHRRQIAQLADRLPSTGAFRLERLRGFGAALGTLVTCGCARLDFTDGSQGILVAAADAVGRAMPLVERLQRLVDGIDTPIASFARDGMFIGGSDAARSLLGFRNLTEAGLDEARSDALREGRVETPIGIGHLVLQRVGTGADVGLVALIAPGPPAVDQPATDHEQPPISGDTPAAFALVDEFAEEPEAALEAASTEPAPEPTPDDGRSEISDISSDAPRAFALIDEFAEEPAQESAQQEQESAQQESAEHGSALQVTHDTPIHPSTAPAAEVEAVAEQPPFVVAAPPPPATEAPAPMPSRAALLPTRRHGSTSRRRIRGGIRCASCGRWTPTAASRSAPTNSPA